MTRRRPQENGDATKPLEVSAVAGLNQGFPTSERILLNANGGNRLLQLPNQVAELLLKNTSSRTSVVFAVLTAWHSAAIRHRAISFRPSGSP